jgi:hypothetical protein
MEERKNKPSASAFYRYANCAASWSLEKGLPEEPPGPDAESGSAIHASLAGEEYRELTADERDTFSKCGMIEKIVIQKILGVATGAEIVREKRIWSAGGGEDCVYSGKFDALYLRGNIALVIDYKTGRIAVDSAVENYQAKALVNLIMEYYGVYEIYFAVIQPHAFPNHSIVRFVDTDLRRNRAYVYSILDRMNHPDEPFAGAWCKYCRARHTCPALNKSSDLMVLDTESLDQIHADQLAELLTRCERGAIVIAEMERRIKLIKDETKRRLQADSKSVPGWKIKPGAQVRHIADAQAAYQRLSPIIPVDDYVSCCKVQISKLDEKLAERFGNSKDEAKKTLRAALGELLEYSENEPSIVREK